VDGSAGNRTALTLAQSPPLRESHHHRAAANGGEEPASSRRWRSRWYRCSSLTRGKPTVLGPEARLSFRIKEPITVQQKTAARPFSRVVPMTTAIRARFGRVQAVTPGTLLRTHLITRVAVPIGLWTYYPTPATTAFCRNLLRRLLGRRLWPSRLSAVRFPSLNFSFSRERTTRCSRRGW